jgi:cell division protein FtsB
LDFRCAAKRGKFLLGKAIFIRHYKEEMAVPITWWNRLSGLAVFLMFAAGGVAATLWILPEIQNNQELQRQKIQLAGKVDRLQEELEECKVRVDHWENDPKAVERLARERLRFSRSGETIIFFVPPPARVEDLSPSPAQTPAARSQARR